MTQGQVLKVEIRIYHYPLKNSIIGIIQQFNKLLLGTVYSKIIANSY